MNPQPTNLNLELLIKLLKLTTSPIDGEALAAMRKANTQLSKVGGDWERLLRGKVTLAADPFAGSPPAPVFRSPPRGTAPPRPKPNDQWGRAPGHRHYGIGPDVNGNMPESPYYGRPADRWGRKPGERDYGVAPPPPKPAYNPANDPFAFGAGAFRGSKPGGSAPKPSAFTDKGYAYNRFRGSCFCCGVWVDPGDGFLFTPQNQRKPAVVCAACNGPSVKEPAVRATPRDVSLNNL